MLFSIVYDSVQELLMCLRTNRLSGRLKCYKHKCHYFRSAPPLAHAVAVLSLNHSESRSCDNKYLLYYSKL